jgi:hypothetical protein
MISYAENFFLCFVFSRTLSVFCVLRIILSYDTYDTLLRVSCCLDEVRIFHLTLSRAGLSEIGWSESWIKWGTVREKFSLDPLSLYPEKMLDKVRADQVRGCRWFIIWLCVMYRHSEKHCWERQQTLSVSVRLSDCHKEAFLKVREDFNILTDWYIDIFPPRMHKLLSYYYHSNSLNRLTWSTNHDKLSYDNIITFD